MTEPEVKVGTSRRISAVDQDQNTATLESLAANARPVDELIAEWRQDPEMRAEMDARDAIRRYGIVEVVVRNAIVQGPVMRSKAAWKKNGGSGFAQEFDDLDEARQFAEEHKWFFNNCRVRVSYLARYETRIQQVPAYARSFTAPMVDRDVTYTVWRDVPGWETGESDRVLLMHVRSAARQKTRYVVLGGPGGRMAMVPAGSQLLTGRYADWFRLAVIRVRGHVGHARLHRIYEAVRRAWGCA